MKGHFLAVAAALLCSLNAVAQDTIRVLPDVEVSSVRVPTVTTQAEPTQVLTARQLEERGAVQLSDAVRHMAGVTLKDYGGVGGMKTVSARGLGSQFSLITIDGVPVDNAQNGQVDLGRYLLAGMAYVSFSQGQDQEMLQCARAVAAGNVLAMASAPPFFYAGHPTNLRLSMDVGSFGTLSPTATWEQRWSSRLHSSLMVNHLRSRGDYPFTLYYTPSHDGNSSIERRKHSAMSMTTADANLYFAINPQQQITAKLHYMGGWHQLPGHVSFYRQEESAQSSHEQLAFAQLCWSRESHNWQTRLVGKWQMTYDQYEDSNYIASANHYLMNEYRQREAYLSASAVLAANQWMDLALSLDGDHSTLQSNLSQRNNVQRNNLMGAFSLRLHGARWVMKGSLSGVAVADRVADLDTMPTFRRLTPYLSFTYRPRTGLTLRSFYKQGYRVPSFSELYFFQSLPRTLRPERAHQFNIGIALATTHGNATLDAYFNRVADKIVARPGQNMYYWTMENLGLVHIAGIDATATAEAGPFEVQGNYSFAYAVDRTDPHSAYYGHQIRYTPRHSGGFSLRYEHRWVNLGASAMVVGHRYTMPQNTAATRLPAYCDVAISADRRLTLPHGTLALRAQVANLFDVQYEVVQFYPMMGRNYKFSISYEY